MCLGILLLLFFYIRDLIILCRRFCLLSFCWTQPGASRPHCNTHLRRKHSIFKHHLLVHHIKTCWTDLHNAGLCFPLADQFLDGGQNLLHHHKHLQRGRERERTSHVLQLPHAPPVIINVQLYNAFFVFGRACPRHKQSQPLC